MNILLLSNHLNIGGITSYLLTLSCGLKRLGHKVYIASSAGQLLGQFEAAGIDFIHLPIRTKSEASPKVFFSTAKAAAAIRKFHIDIAHSHSRTTQVLGCLLHRFTGVAHVSTCHGFFKRRLSRIIFPCWGQKVIAISESVREHLIQDFKVPEKDITVIHTGIDVEKFRAQSAKCKADLRNNLGLRDGPVIGITARLSEEKGHSYLIKAMQAVIKEFASAQLLIVGDGRLKQGLSELSKKLGLEKSIRFIPSVADIKEVLSVMDIFALVSTKEGLGLAAMEAMAMGICVVGSDVGGIKTLIRDGYNGIFVKPADSHDLSLKIKGLLGDSGKREQLGINARNFIRENFSQEKMAKETERVYYECLNLKN